MAKNKYTINVSFDLRHTFEVEATSEQEAYEELDEIINRFDLNEAICEHTNYTIVNTEKI